MSSVRTLTLADVALPRAGATHHALLVIGASLLTAAAAQFAIHLPWIDRIFGTHYLPKDDRWPETYGLHEEKIPFSFWGQFFYPLLPGKKIPTT